MIFDVGSSAQLNNAMNAAKSGDTIRLAAGDYGLVTIKDIKFAGNVTITSADSSNQAVLRGIDMRNSAGITVSNVEISVKANAAWNERLYVNTSERITLDSLNVHGTLDGKPGDVTDLAFVRNSKNVVVSNSEFHEGTHGLNFLDVENLKIADNSFHDLRIDGVRGGGVRGLEVVNNSFTDFYPEAGDHPDAIQLWTTNTTVASRDILIADNIITRGDGGQMQGIFVRDDVTNLAFQNLTIERNFVSGAMFNGIMVDGGKNVSVTDNVVLGTADSQSWIRLQAVDGVEMADNTATKYTQVGLVTNLTGSNNATVAAPTDGAVAALKAFLAGGAAQVEAVAKSVASLVELPKAVTAPAVQQPIAAPAASGSRLDGTAGADTLSDTKFSLLAGGGGDDTYVVSRTDTKIVETANGGQDMVKSTVSYTLGDNVERLVLLGNTANGTGNNGDNTIQANDSANILRGLGGDDRLDGKGGNDILYGDDGDDYLTGGLGNDQLFGGNGIDYLLGDAGADTLNGGAGDDVLTGGAGLDHLTGGAGADRFIFTASDFLSAQKGADIIWDFKAPEGDKIFLNQIDGNTLTAARDKLAFIGTQAFTKLPGQLRYEVSGGNATVHADVNGDGVADFSIMMKHVTSLSAADFVL